MDFTSTDLDKIINILNRNPFASYKEIGSHVNCSNTEICKLFKELRQEYNSEQVIEQFLENNKSNKDPILFISGVLQSICRPEIDQSFNLAAVFEDIGLYYEEMENLNDEDINYSTIYKYIAALISNKKLPSLDHSQEALILSIIFEVLNFSEQTIIRRPNVFKEFTGAIQTQLAQFLIKTGIPVDEWNEVNNKELIKAFNIPHIPADKVKDDPTLANKKIQKAVAFHSLNPFHLSSEQIVPFHELVDEMFEEDNANHRNLKLFNEILGINIDQFPIIANVDNGNKLIVHQKRVEKIPRINSGKPLKTNEEIEIENQIFEKIGKHEIINLVGYKKSLQNTEEPVKKKKKIVE